MAATDLPNRKILIWSPMGAGQPFLACIEGTQIYCRGATAMKAKAKAEALRAAEYERLTSKRQRAEAGR
jgi:hypothetical protein